MEVYKKQNAGGGCSADESDLALINNFAKGKLTADMVYTFSVRLCDNEVDRDGERFTDETLERLAELFVGKSGIFDHDWTAKGQTARIYKTEVISDGEINVLGQPYKYVKACAYMLKNAANAALIEEIEGGIKKEVSVGCSVARTVCSICGSADGDCGHVRGVEYGGKLCCGELCDATDAYEWSFVAVPAQKKAGVIKGFNGKEINSLDMLMENNVSKSCREEYEKLRSMSKLGESYMKALRSEVSRLAGIVESEVDKTALDSIIAKLDESELNAVRTALNTRADKLFPIKSQFAKQDTNNDDEKKMFLI